MSAIVGKWLENLRKTVKDGDVGKQQYFDIILVGFSEHVFALVTLFLFSLKFNCLQRVFLNEKIDDNC